MQKVNNEIYNDYGDRWYTADDDPIALLRAESKAKTPWTLEQIKKHHHFHGNSRLLDVGCGAGFLSNALATQGLNVTGVDLSEESIAVAKRFDKTGTVIYQKADAYHLPFPDESFDVLTAMDFLEHIEDPKLVIKEFSRVLKPGGIFIFHTFNRNMLAHLIIIKLVEWLVKNTPKNMHVIRLFIRPSELKDYCKQAHMNVDEMIGIRLSLRTITLRSLLTGVVPQGLRFKLCSSLLLSYMGVAQKHKSMIG
jgi:2-polyprenyl-6-hydroxyphenyl methylase/3-demethylubiquinone-9 3-methyltransferase